MLIILLVVLVSLHLVILPSASGGYNDECYLTDEKRQNFEDYGAEYLEGV